MNTANKITLLRIILVPVFMALFLIDSFAFRMAALAVFVIASISDAADGYIARHYNQITTFGKFIDPIADKLLVTAAFVVLLYYDRMSPWALIIVLAREFIVTGLRLVAVSEGKVIAASMWGKAKTVSQMIAIIVAIALMNNILPADISLMVTHILIWISALLTVISGVDYLVKNRRLLNMK